MRYATLLRMTRPIPENAELVPARSKLGPPPFTRVRVYMLARSCADSGSFQDASLSAGEAPIRAYLRASWPHFVSELDRLPANGRGDLAFGGCAAVSDTLLARAEPAIACIGGLAA